MEQKLGETEIRGDEGRECNICVYREQHETCGEQKSYYLCAHNKDSEREKKTCGNAKKKRRSKLVADHVEVGDGAESGPEH